jgi:hemolysin III
MYELFKHAREPMSSYTHFLGILFSAVATIFLVVLNGIQGDFSARMLFSVLAFGGSMLALYSASSIYHFYNGPVIKQERLRKLDHAMIYVLIAGSYTPICLKFMEGVHGIVFTLAIWLVAICGIVVKLCWMNAPRWLYTGFYLLMGWAIVFDWKALQMIPGGAIALLLAGGISYSIGAVFYILKKPNISKIFGFHELFHVFILLGTFFHFLTVLFYVVL